MRKNRKYSDLIIWISAVLVVALFAVGYINKPEEQTLTELQERIENCKLRQAEISTFDPQSQILTVIKRFGNGYRERTRYCLSLLPAVNPQTAAQKHMLRVSVSDGQTVVFDQSGNAYLIR